MAADPSLAARIDGEREALIAASLSYMLTAHLTRDQGQHQIFVVEADPDWDDFHDARINRDHSEEDV